MGSLGSHLPCSYRNHHGHAGNRLRHGIGAEDNVFAHGRVLRNILLPISSVFNHFAVARQYGYRARQGFSVNLTLNQRVQVLQALA